MTSSWEEYEVLRLKRAKHFRVAEYVWCDTHGEIHERTLTPYGPGDECNSSMYVDPCVGTDTIWRDIYVKRLKGDYPHDDA